METEVNYTLVGAFVIALISAIVLAIIWLSSGLSLTEYSTYKVYMKEAVSGLSLESPVEYNGVDVGSVKNISINHKNPKLVVLLLNIKSSTPITKGTTASLDIKGLTGNTFIALEDKGTDLTPLTAEDDETYPIINTTPSFFLKLDTALSSLTDSLHQVSNSMRALLDNDNLRLIKGTLRNLDKLTSTLSAKDGEINAIIQNTARASRQLSPLLMNTDQTISNMDTITTNLTAASYDIKQNPAVLIRGKQQQHLGPGEQ